MHPMKRLMDKFLSNTDLPLLAAWQWINTNLIGVLVTMLS